MAALQDNLEGHSIDWGAKALTLIAEEGELSVKFFRAMVIAGGVASVLCSGAALAGSLIGIFVGEPLSEVTAKLRAYGEVSELSGQGYVAGDYIVQGCKGRVWAVSRSLSPAFRSFAAAARKTELELGAEPRAKVVSDDGTQDFSMVKLQWDLGDGSLRTLMYVESLSGKGVTEAVEQKMLCKNSAK